MGPPCSRISDSMAARSFFDWSMMGELELAESMSAWSVSAAGRSWPCL